MFFGAAGFFPAAFLCAGGLVSSPRFPFCAGMTEELAWIPAPRFRGDMFRGNDEGGERRGLGYEGTYSRGDPKFVNIINGT